MAVLERGGSRCVRGGDADGVAGGPSENTREADERDRSDDEHDHVESAGVGNDGSWGGRTEWKWQWW